MHRKYGPYTSRGIANLFNRFYRLESQITGMGGSGLGLAFAKSIVDLHHGDMG